MKLVKVEENRHDPDPYWTKPAADWMIDSLDEDALRLFDQNGYDMCHAEQIFALYNGYIPKHHREKWTNKKTWMIDSDNSCVGAHINHCDIYQRRAFAGNALDQLKEKAKKCPLFHKLIRMKPKWGVDISIDYVDFEGNAFELLHFEWDDTVMPEVLYKMTEIETLFLGKSSIFWEEKAQEMWNRRKEWKNLPFFEQSDWKQAFWGLPKEQFKEVIWD